MNWERAGTPRGRRPLTRHRRSLFSLFWQVALRLGIASWRDLDIAQLQAALQRLDTDEERDYVEHVVRETARTHDASLALLDNNITLFGQLMTASHESLRFALVPPPLIAQGQI